MDQSKGSLREDMFDDLLVENDSNHAFIDDALSFFADSLELSHGISPGKWGLSRSDGYLRLNVGFCEVLTCSAESLRVLVNHAVAEECPDVRNGNLATEAKDNGEDYYKTAPGSRLITLDGNNLSATYLSQIRLAHHENIRIAAKGGWNRGSQNGHRNEAVGKLSEFTRRILPYPAYDCPPEELESTRPEGRKQLVFSQRYERNARIRKDAVKFHGLICKACDFDFATIYGNHGAGFIHVHHLQPLSEVGEETTPDPKTDLTVLCANCHSMVHRQKDKTLTVEELIGLIQEQRTKRESKLLK